MTVTVDLINASSESVLPSLKEFQHWATKTMLSLQTKSGNEPADKPMAELSIRLIDEDESADLNVHFRQKQGATNILSFPCAEMPMTEINLIGDLAICAPVVIREAKEQSKPSIAHWAHITIHGILHLNNFDHENSHDAEQMEKLEIQILHTLGYANPYI